MERTRVAAFILTLLLIVPMLFLPNSLGYYIRDPKDTVNDERNTKPVLGLFDQEPFTYVMLLVIEGFYYYFLLATLFPTIFFIFWSSLVKWRERSSKGRLRKWFILTHHGKDTLPMGVDREMAFPLVIKSKLTREKEYPDVSLIIPCYNEEQNVAQAIENAFLQDYPGQMEIIVVDDGSRDNTLAISREVNAERSTLA